MLTESAHGGEEERGVADDGREGELLRVVEGEVSVGKEAAE